MAGWVVKQQLKMVTQAHQPSHVKRKMPQGHTKRDEPVSHLPHSVSQPPVSKGKREAEGGG